MRCLSAVLVFAIALLPVSVSLAGSFEAGLVKDSDFNRWVCRDVTPSPRPTGYACRRAGFGDCAQCDTIVLTNTSGATLSADIEISGDGFDDHVGGGAFAFLANCPDRDEPAPTMPCHSVAAGGRCLQDFEFCPSHSGESKGEIKITVQGPHGTETQTIPIVANAVYSSAIQGAESILNDHRAELTKLPHVKRVSIDKDGDTISIKVEVEGDSDDDVDHVDEDIEQAQRMIPPQIEGLPVEVTRYEDVGYASEPVRRACGWQINRACLPCARACD